MKWLGKTLKSQTRVAVLESRWPGETQETMEAKHILFPEDDERYMEKLVHTLKCVKDLKDKNWEIVA